MTRRAYWPALLALAVLPTAALAGDDMNAAGRQLYLRYCSACHGEEAKGDGIVAPLMSPHPADLTQLAKRDNGVFPFQSVTKTIDGRERMRAHGDPDMPVWGDLLSKEESTSLGNQSIVRTKVASITAYLRSIQAK
ncbi:MAG: c-type cytochrome [bacterium]